MKCVLIFSGGLDSTVLLYQLLDQGHHVLALSFRYGQRHEKELKAARALSEQVFVPHEVVDLSSLSMLFSDNALTSHNVPLPQGPYSQTSLPATWVPNRNLIFLSLAGAYAVKQKAQALAYAAHAGDHPLYPDCGAAFVKAAQQTLQLSTDSSLKLLAPFLQLSKAQIIQKGTTFGVPFQSTWSCYLGGSLHCGNCPTCLERLEAFQACGLKDPVSYLKNVSVL